MPAPVGHEFNRGDDKEESSGSPSHRIEELSTLNRITISSSFFTVQPIVTFAPEYISDTFSPSDAEQRTVAVSVGVETLNFLGQEWKSLEILNEIAKNKVEEYLANELSVVTYLSAGCLTMANELWEKCWTLVLNEERDIDPFIEVIRGLVHVHNGDLAAAKRDFGWALTHAREEYVDIPEILEGKLYELGYPELALYCLGLTETSIEESHHQLRIEIALARSNPGDAKIALAALPNDQMLANLMTARMALLAKNYELAFECLNVANPFGDVVGDPTTELGDMCQRLRIDYMVATRNFDQARLEIQSALELDPTNRYLGPLQSQLSDSQVPGRQSPYMLASLPLDVSVSSENRNAILTTAALNAIVSGQEPFIRRAYGYLVRVNDLVSEEPELIEYVSLLQYALLLRQGRFDEAYAVLASLDTEAEREDSINYDHLEALEEAEALKDRDEAILNIVKSIALKSRIYLSADRNCAAMIDHKACYFSDQIEHPYA